MATLTREQREALEEIQVLARQLRDSTSTRQSHEITEKLESAKKRLEEATRQADGQPLSSI